MAQIPLVTQDALDEAVESIEAATVPAGGSAGQVLTKASGDDLDVEWQTPTGGGGGGDGDMSAAVYDPTDIAADAFNRGNHYGTMSAGYVDGLATVATTGAYSDLSGRPTLGTAAAQDSSAFDAAGAAADAFASAVQRANHTGTQAISTVAGLQTALDGKADNADIADLDTTHWHIYTEVDEARVGSGKVEVWMPSPATLADPDNAGVDDIVFRVTPGVGQVYVLDGEEYVPAGGRTFIGATEPSGVDPVNGDQWIDPAGGVHYLWWDTEWVVVGGDPPEPTAPGKVAGLTATPGNGTVTLAWSAPSTGGSAITDYIIERAPDDEGVPGAWGTLTDGTSTTTGYVDDDVTNGLTYWYRVSAVNTIGTGDPSDPEAATPTGPPPPAGPFLVAYDPMPYTATASPVVTLDEYDPVENDVVFAFIGSTTTGTVTVPSGWASVIDSPYIVVPGDTTLVGLCVYHVITDTEESGDTNSWTLTNLFSTTEIGEIIAVVVRVADPADVIDAYNTVSNASTSTNHTLPSLEGDDLSNDSLVLSLVLADGMQTYDSAPAGWTSISPTTGTNMGGHLYQLDAYTETGVDIPAATVVASSADETVGLTVAIRVAP